MQVFNEPAGSFPVTYACLTADIRSASGNLLIGDRSALNGAHPTLAKK